MKYYFLVLFALSVTFCAKTQIIPSDCTAHDSIVAQYQDDADALTLDRILANNYSYEDSIVIPPAYVDTVLNALIAVYNLPSEPNRDTVIDILNIHFHPLFALDMIYLSADSTLYWMQNLGNGNPSGHPTLDSIMNDYNFSVFSYYPSPIPPNANVLFESSDNYNTVAISQIIDTIFGVAYCEPDLYVGDGPTIAATVFPTHVELIYAYKWGDCPSGCLAARYWKFNVYYDCGVEFVESSGSVLPNAGLESVVATDLSVYPNPFTNEIHIESEGNHLPYYLTDISGKELSSGEVTDGRVSQLEKLSAGSYVIHVQIDGMWRSSRIVKY